jgi:hypothetical protein
MSEVLQVKTADKKLLFACPSVGGFDVYRVEMLCKCLKRGDVNWKE